MFSTALQPNDSFSTGLTVWNDIAQQPAESRVITLSTYTPFNLQDFEHKTDKHKKDPDLGSFSLIRFVLCW